MTGDPHSSVIRVPRTSLDSEVIRHRLDAFQDDVKSARESEIERIIVQGYGGEILSIVDGAGFAAAELPDSFTVRVKVSGKGLRDFVLNFPYIFEVVEPDDVDLLQSEGEAWTGEYLTADLVPPPVDALAVCVIDSGIQERHILLEPAIDKPTSFCFLQGRPTDVADYVRPGGHGTRVAGAVLYREVVPKSGVYTLPCWVQNARVLDDNGILPKELFPPALVRTVVERYHNGLRRTRIFNHSINSNCHCRLRHMSAWAAEIDRRFPSMMTSEPPLRSFRLKSKQRNRWKLNSK